MLHDLLVGQSVLSRVVVNDEGRLEVDSDGILSIDFCQAMAEDTTVDDHGVVQAAMEAGR